MSEEFTKIEDNNLEEKALLDEIGFSIDQISIEPDRFGVFFNISYYCIYIYGIIVTKNNEFYEVELPYAANSPWSTEFPVIAFWNAKHWSAIRSALIREIEKNAWLLENLNSK